MTASNVKRFLLITGSNVLKYQLHLVPTRFYTLLEEASDVVWDHAVTAEAALAENPRREYDALVFFCFFETLSEVAINHLRAFMEAGKGILVVHSGLASFMETDMWAREVVGVRYHHAATADKQKTVSTLDVEMIIRPAGEHPINRGLTEFELVDEAYKGLEIVSPTTPLFETDHPASDGPVAWTGPSPTCRTVVLEPGHTAETFSNPTYREIVHRSLAWVARIER